MFRLPAPILSDITGLFAKVSASNNYPIGSSDYKDLYILEPGLVYPAAAGDLSATLEITIEGGLTVTIPSSELGMSNMFVSLDIEHHC